MKSFEVFSDVKEEGKLQNNARGVIAHNLKLMIGKRVRVLVEVVRNKRSDRQNRFYQKYYIQSQIDCFKERWGEIYTRDQIHTWNKANIWHSEHIDEGTGEIYKMPCSSTEQTKGSWEERLEMGRQFFKTNFNWDLPYPNQQGNLDIE